MIERGVSLIYLMVREYILDYDKLLYKDKDSDVEYEDDVNKKKLLIIIF